MKRQMAKDILVPCICFGWHYRDIRTILYGNLSQSILTAQFIQAPISNNFTLQRIHINN